MTTFVSIIIAAIFNAMMDRLENENFYSSIFRDWTERFWYKRTSWKYATKVFNYPVDGWHLSKSAMIICLFVAVVNYEPVINPLIDFLIFGSIWNFTFQFFYERIFKG